MLISLKIKKVDRKLHVKTYILRMTKLSCASYFVIIVIIIIIVTYNSSSSSLQILYYVQQLVKIPLSLQQYIILPMPYSTLLSLSPLLVLHNKLVFFCALLFLSTVCFPSPLLTWFHTPHLLLSILFCIWRCGEQKSKQKKSSIWTSVWTTQRRRLRERDCTGDADSINW